MQRQTCSHTTGSTHSDPFKNTLKLAFEFHANKSTSLAVVIIDDLIFFSKLKKEEDEELKPYLLEYDILIKLHLLVIYINLLK